MDVMVSTNCRGQEEHWLRHAYSRTAKGSHAWLACNGNSFRRTKRRTKWVKADSVTLLCDECSRLLANAVAWEAERELRHGARTTGP